MALAVAAARSTVLAALGVEHALMSARTERALRMRVPSPLLAATPPKRKKVCMSIADEPGTLQAKRRGRSQVPDGGIPVNEGPDTPQVKRKGRIKVLDEPDSVSGSDTPRKARQKPTHIDPPVGWKRTYDLIVELRADRTAVVDSMGSEAMAAAAGNQATQDERNYQTLVSLMLSSQTKDTVNAATMVKLRAHGLSVDNILATSDDELRDLIYGVGFHNNKVKFIKHTTRILKDQYGGSVPNTMEELIALPGVGPKVSQHFHFHESPDEDTYFALVCRWLSSP